MTLDLTKAEIALIQRGVSYLQISGWAEKPEKALAVSLLARLGCGLLPAIRDVHQLTSTVETMAEPVRITNLPEPAQPPPAAVLCPKCGRETGPWNGKRRCVACDWSETLDSTPLTNAERLQRQGRIFNHDGKCGKIVT